MWATEVDPDADEVADAVRRLRDAEAQLTDYGARCTSGSTKRPPSTIVRYRENPAGA